MMDPTVDFMWQRHCGGSPDPVKWAMSLVDVGLRSPAIDLIASNYFVPEDQEKLVTQALHEIGKSVLLDKFTLNQEYERENIQLYFAGEIDGWTLIRKCCQQFFDNESIDPSRRFWLVLDEEASEYDGTNISLKWHSKEFFDENLRATILASGRPIPCNVK